MRYTSEKPKILAIIPARGGSKGIPRKNLYPVSLIPMIEYTIQAAKRSYFITDVNVSSDDQEILDLASEGRCYPIHRPKSISGDDTTCEEVISHLVDELEKVHTEYDAIVLLQPTSPLRTSEHVDEAIRKYLDSDCKSLVSVYEPAKSPLKAFAEMWTDEGKINPISDYSFITANRQQLPKCYYPNGAIYIVDYKTFKLNRQIIQTDCTIPYVMPESLSVDVDTLDDIMEIERILSIRRDMVTSSYLSSIIVPGENM